MATSIVDLRIAFWGGGNTEEIAALQTAYNNGLSFADIVNLTIPQTGIANASTAHALSAIFSDTEVEAALNALGTKINAIITALETANILTTV